VFNLINERTPYLLSVFELQLEKKHDILIGDSPLDLKRRNAVTNALIDLLGEKSGADTLLVRDCLYAIAPAELWQFYSAQGLSGSCKSSLYGRMIHLYKAVLVAVVAKTGKEKSAVVRAISEVLKTVHNRAGPYKYRKAHPEEVLRHCLGHVDQEGNLIPDFAKRSRGKKRPATTATPSAAEPSGKDEFITPPAGEDSETQRGESECRRNPTRSVRPRTLRMPSVEESDEELSNHPHCDSDDSLKDADYGVPAMKALFKYMM
jgi:hypothetical protein